MIKKDDVLNNESIKIVSYNYEESNGFSQETAVESHNGKFKEHKFVINVQGQMYSLEFLYAHVTKRYVAMEEEWIESIRTIVDNHRLTVKTFHDNNIYSSITKNILSIKGYGQDIEEFKNKLIKTANNLGIGCESSMHINTEDDFVNTYPDKEFSAPATISDERLYINENEKDLFNEYLSLKTPEEEQSFLNSLEDKVSEFKKQDKIKAKIKAQKEKETIVNKLLQEYSDLEKNNKNTESKKEKILEHIDGIELEDSIINERRTKSYVYPAPKTFEPWEYSDYFDDEYDPDEYDPDEYVQRFNSNEEYEYLRNRSATERFKFIKTYIKSELINDIIPNELKDAFDIKEELTDTLNKTDSPNQKVKKRKRKF